MLKQALCNHMLRNSEDLRASEGPSADPDSQKNHVQVPPEHPDTPDGNGAFKVNMKPDMESLHGYKTVFLSAPFLQESFWF